MEEGSKIIRLSKAAKEFNVGITTIVDFLGKKGFKLENNPNTKISPEMYDLLAKEYQKDKSNKEQAKKIEIEYQRHQTISIDDKKTRYEEEELEKEKEPAELIFKTSIFDHPEKARETKKVETIAPEITEPVKPVPEEKVKEKEKQPEPATEEKIEKPVEKIVEMPAKEILPEEKPVKEIGQVVEIIQEEKPIEEKPATKPVEPVAKQEESVVVKQEPTVKQEEFIAIEEPATKKEESPALPKPEDETTIEGIGDSQIKILGKIDVDSFGKKSKGKSKKQQPHPDKETTFAPEEIETVPVATQIPTGAELQPEIPELKIPEEKEQKDISIVAADKPSNFMRTEVKKLEGPTILGSIKLPEARKPEAKKPVASSSDDIMKTKKKKRKRIKKQGTAPTAPTTTATATGSTTAQTDKNKSTVSSKARDKKGKKDFVQKPEFSEEDIQRQIKETLQRLSSGSGKSKASKHRREKRALVSQHMLDEQKKHEEDKMVLKATEFVTANELATMMNVPVNQVISTCMSLGLFVSINQRLDAETLVLVADEFGYKVEFVSVEVQEAIKEIEEPDAAEDLLPRAPVVTVMGHVDHGKTSLLDYIRNTNVIAGEAGGITQHIGAYEVKLKNGKKITFLDTPGHEAFTAMRARGAKITDVAIIVVAADDTVMPQTIEAINHAQAASIPIVFAINKIDKPNANVEKIKEELSKINILVEDWGGKYQSQEISAKKGINVDLLLEKVLLEAEMLDLKANHTRPAIGTVIESALDKGRGYIAKLLVQNGTMKIGDIVLAGSTYGRIKAMYNERNQSLPSVGPATPVLLLGLNGAPQAGDNFNVMLDEREAKNIAIKRQQLQREQGLRTQKHITLDEIGRRIAIGDFKELNIIIKGDVDGSVEALSDSLLKLSTQQVQVNIIHKSVGAVTESDVLLASASNAIIIAFQVRPSVSARKLAEQEQIDVRMYSIIYNAINEIKDAIEGMLSPEIQEKITCNIEIREIFKIAKVGTIAGCFVLDGKMNRNTKIRVIRDGIVVYSGSLASLKRFKDDVKEVVAGQDCGLNIMNFNDIKVGDIIEGYEEFEVKRKL